MKVMRQLNRLAAGTAVAAIAAVAGAGLAQADGMPGKRVVDEKPWDGGGLDSGVHSGWQWSTYDTAYTSFPTSWGVDHDFPVVGGQIGIQHQFGQIVVGVEAAGTAAYLDNHGSTDCPNPAFSCTARFDNVLTIGPRLGYAMGKWMPYITGGSHAASARSHDTRILKANQATFFSQAASRKTAGTSAVVLRWLCRTDGPWVSNIATTISAIRSTIPTRQLA